MPTLSPKVTPYYGGGQVVNPANVIQTTSAPTTDFTQDNLGTIWVDYSVPSAYILVAKSGGVDTWQQIQSSGGAGVFTSLTVTGAASFSGGTFTVQSGTNAINISANANATTINIGTGAAAKTITIGSSTSTSITNIKAGSGGIIITGNISGGGTIGMGGVFATGDTGGVPSATGFTNVNSTTISSGVGSVLMSSANAANNAAWIKIYIGATAYFIPAWLTNSP